MSAQSDLSKLRALTAQLLNHVTENDDSVMKKVAKEFDLVAPKPLNSIISAANKMGLVSFETRDGKAKKYWNLADGVSFSFDGTHAVLSFEVNEE